MAERLLLDTDILIDDLRGRAEAVAYLESRSEPLAVSVITVAELYAGVCEGEERTKLILFLSALGVIPVDAQIATRGGLLRRDYSKSHSTGLGDALIAATAEIHQTTLVTLNAKHFPMVPGIHVPYAKDGK